MPLETLRRVIRIHPDTVVIHLNQLDTAPLYRHMNAVGLGVQSIFDQLFHHGSRAFDDFARSNMIDDVIRKALNPAHVDVLLYKAHNCLRV